MKEKKKICFITSSPVSARSFLKIPIKALSSEFDICYVGNYNDPKEIAELDVDQAYSIKIERKPNIKADIIALWKLYSLFKREKFYSVHAITRKATLLTGIASFLARVPHRIKTFTGQIWVNMHGVKRKLYMTLDKLDVILNTDLLVDGESQRQYLIANGIMKDQDAKVLAYGSICGVDTSRFKSSSQVRQTIRKELGYCDDDIVFVFLGRLKKEKGIYELLEAFNNLIEKRPDAKLLLIGPDEEECQKDIAKYANLKEGVNVIVYGSTSEPQKLLQAGDIFVLPTYREGFGLSVLEASCLGLPVICSDTYGVMDAMVDNITGLRCKTADSKTLQECMEKLYDSPDLRTKLGKNGMERVKTKFSNEILSEAWLNFYKGLV